ncbi:MAG: restriction endonuclease [Chloroflexi bacterium]|nr:restriction endonuclease [Chloroflexota bacterium]
MPTILDRWDISLDELTEVVNSNPSLQGFLIGYIGEFKLRKIWFSDGRVENVHKFDDHDRRHKNDLAITYQGCEFTIEVKSLQTNSVRQEGDDYRGAFQCDASDRRMVVLPNGRKVETTCLLVGGFDLIAVNLYAFRHAWEFAFALNRDLPRTENSKYTLAQRKHLLATSMKITLPVEPPFVNNPFTLLDRLVAEKQA